VVDEGQGGKRGGLGGRGKRGQYWLGMPGIQFLRSRKHSFLN
jgi:hypothetical protein